MLGLYIHVPFCAQKCYYCDFNSYKIKSNEKEDYLINIEREMHLYKDEFKDKYFDTVFLGGGTPSILKAEELSRLFDKLHENFNIKKDAEITIECNPGTINKEKLKFMKKMGINRLSIGLQAVQNYHLKSIGRIHTYEEFERNYYDAIAVGFNNINIDLMYALPNQKEDEWRETLNKIISLNPSHISAYSLILEEGTKLYDMYENNEFKLLDEDTDIKMYEYTINTLKKYGYNQYEISNYAKTEKECKHNIIYWKCDNYLGLGPGASGYIDNKRYSNVENLKTYNGKLSKNLKPINEEIQLSEKDKIEEFIFMGLRMNEGINLDVFKERFNIEFLDLYKDILDKLIENKLLKLDGSNIMLTQKGREISNSVFIEFIN
ncbi:MAG: radical SAM family heme chaperone HemW [Paraclostridium sordellii]|uniref:radical SAM family heme chaperone HemW n=1 Tax=Paraclostridium sordellii TaxID=1505 RepID=UPI0005E2A19A|nr:radical SAM family heme chaperone HemW [Paeniclostridium sordellii]MCH1965140.1 radical SAM family heme chaperone HemW [Paeniclostridium sordellii]CEN84655.1 Oxygen-independent coproporphyrinogen-III oxidase (Coproporphyrinogenase) (Coprogen oxidase) [[Clostridium] sordellii] [Paeniclostridium sordellii]CEP84787.1 Oxygen-independent coproporphyrinogen-III oxidase (Coproporphyrinogenase) (Coprogen oxidase) [[Clostridium] sordellii] [Paeniclostridium sordellii]CEQ22560.1 Oxygen-independent cop